MIKIKDLSFAYGENKIFNNFSLEINERLAFLVGKNGAGKTTLLKLIHGDLKNYTGEIISDDAFVVSQSFMLFDELNGYDNIAIAIGLAEKEVKNLVKTSPFYINGLERKLKFMTTIEKQTLELIAMSLSEKKLILLDEVSAALDYMTSKKLIDYIKSSNKSFLMVSHDEDFIQNFDAREIFLDKQKNILDQKNEVLENNPNKKIIGIYIKDDAKINEVLKKFKQFAYVPKDVRMALLMDEAAYKNIFIYDILKNIKTDYIKRRCLH